MLSRVAEQLYWMARYLERSDNTARLIKTTSQQILDARRPANWRAAVDILGSDPLFDALGLANEERPVLHFLVDETAHPGSIRASIGAARENARTVRELLPTEVWEGINALYKLTRQQAIAKSTRRQRQDLLRRITELNQQINGIIAGTLSQGAPYHVIMLAQYLERADMTSRILDSQITAPAQTWQEAQWMATLDSLGGYLMYRQSMHARLEVQAVTQFLMLDPAFPRSVRFCLRRIGDSLLALPHAEPVIRTLEQLDRQHATAAPHTLNAVALHGYIDELQAGLGKLHAAIAKRYFPEPL